MAKRGRKKGLSRLDGMSDVIAESVKGAAGVAYGGALSDQRRQVKQAKAQKRVINEAFKAYQRQLGMLQGAQQAAVDRARESNAATATALQGIAGQQTELGAEQAAERAQLLGQGDTVAETIRALGGGASQARLGRAVDADAAMANIGVANFSDLSRRAATGRRDRIRALEDQRNVVGEERDALQQLRKERGGFMADTAFERLQQQEENEIARAGLRLDRKGQRQDAKLAQQELALDVYDTLFDNETARRGQRQDAREGRQDDRGGGGPSLSPSEREEYRRQVNMIEAVVGEYRKLVRSGLDPNQAAKKARKRTGGERWMTKVARDLVSGGSLSSRSRHLLRGKLPPGARIPKQWR